jgi:hypothetical protein
MTITGMPYKLECAQSFSAADASEADINRAFDDDRIRGEYVILFAPDGNFIQAAGEGDGPYVLEHREVRMKDHVRSRGELTKEEVRTAFLQYRRGDARWRTSHEWEPCKTGGCLSAIAIASIVTLVGGALTNC